MSVVANKDFLYAECDCTCKCGNGIEFYMGYDFDEVIVETKFSGFDAYQLKSWTNFKERVRNAWRVLRGKEYIFHEIILKPDNYHQLIEEMIKLEKKIENT